MIAIRKSGERGVTDWGWLDSRHSFSFGEYHDPKHMGFRALRVINDDRIAGGGGFPKHPHRDMEIVTVVFEGALAHGDSLGNGSAIRPGEVQRMTAGTGIRHSEANASQTDPVHLLQIWLLPERAGLEPGYEQKAFAPEEFDGQLRLVASPDGRDGSLTIRQDARIHQARLAPGQSASQALEHGRHAWVQVARGSITLNGQALGEGDGAAVSEETALSLTGVDTADVLVFDLA